MVHLRIVVPPTCAQEALELLERERSTSNLVYLHGAARKPPGDVILCDVAEEEASVVIDELKRMGIARDGSISLAPIDSQLSEAGDRAVHAARGLRADAVVWEEVEARTSENVELSASFVAFMVLACLIATIGIFLGSPILIVGAMVVGPEFGPLAAFCVAIVEKRLDVARRSLRALVVGFPIAIVAALLFTLLSRAVGMVGDDYATIHHPLTNFISDPDEFSLIVACLAGAAGMLSLTSAKSGALIGVLISVTTIPAAANIGVAIAFADWSECRGSIEQLAVNLCGIVIAGVTTLFLQRRLFVRRRREHRAA